MKVVVIHISVGMGGLLEVFYMMYSEDIVDLDDKADEDVHHAHAHEELFGTCTL